MARLRNKISIVFLICSTLGLSGCGAGDIQFEGAVFEAIGATNLGKTYKEPKLKERAPIVLPPDAKLPEPGKRTVVQKKDMQWPEDPDLKRRTEEQVAAAKIKKYCNDGPGLNENHPFYDSNMASKCSTLFSNFLKNTVKNTSE